MTHYFEKLMPGLRSLSGIVLVGLLLSGCDSTPRERQEAARQGARELDTLARTTAQTIARVGKATLATTQPTAPAAPGLSTRASRLLWKLGC